MDKIKCSDCGVVLDKLKALRFISWYEQFGGVEKEYDCFKCGAIFSTRKLLDNLYATDDSQTEYDSRIPGVENLKEPEPFSALTDADVLDAADKYIREFEGND